MKTKLTTLLLLTCSASLLAGKVAQNTVVGMGKNTQVKVTRLDINNLGSLSGDTASLLIISTTGEQKISGNSFLLNALKIDGNVVCEVSELALKGDLIMQSGVMNIGASRLIINGNLLNETAKTYVTASTGAIEKWVDHLPARKSVSALGLEFAPLDDMYEVCITRSHNPMTRTTASNFLTSASRIYEFYTPKDITNVRLETLPHETKHIARGRIFTKNGSEDWEKVSNTNDILRGVYRITVFDPDELHIPKIITPNDPPNNVFRIDGLTEYPNPRLIIMNKGGKILYDVAPYQNDFDASRLSDGTYYYILYGDKHNSEPLQRSFFEIVRK